MSENKNESNAQIKIFENTADIQAAKEAESDIDFGSPIIGEILFR